MADQTAIEWTDATWNPIRAVLLAGTTLRRGWHCEHVSEGCRNCYAEALNNRLGTRIPYKPGHRDTVEHELQENLLTAPLRWRRPRRIFLSSMTDIFGPWVTDAMLDRIFAVMALCPQHTFQVLTKRPERMRAYMTARDQDIVPLVAIREAIDVLSPQVRRGFQWPLPNVWLGTSVEDQRNADERIPHLLAAPAAVRFLSCEPLLAPVDLTAIRGRYWQFSALDPAQPWAPLSGAIGEGPIHCPPWPRIDWVIAGGESGKGARDWPGLDSAMRSLRDQCSLTGAAFFAKQMAGERKPLRPIPDDLMIREFPNG